MKTFRFTFYVLLTFMIAACSAPAATGTLQFDANGEDFVRNGFVSKDGWRIDFDNVFVTLTDIAAYQTDPPYDASSGAEIDGTAVSLNETFTLDLTSETANDAPILVAERTDAAAGQYNAIGWEMVPATSGMSDGAVVLLVGTAVKDGQTVDFNLRFTDPFAYRCGEYVGDERKGILNEGETADVEMTFHLDHIFGDADAPMDEALNQGALGFDPLAAVAQDGSLDMDSAALESALPPADFATLADSLQTLGHVGEGHCYEATGGYTGE